MSLTPMYRCRPASVAPPLPLAKQSLIRIYTRMQMDSFIVWVVMITILNVTAIDTAYKNMIYTRRSADHSLQVGVQSGLFLFLFVRLFFIAPLYFQF